MKPSRDRNGWWHYTLPKPLTWRRAFAIAVVANVLWTVAFYALYKFTRGP